MTTAERIKVEPAVLRWARTTAGYDVDGAARRLGIKSDALARWEAGERSPTIGQLRRAASTFKRPLAALLLSEPPTEPELPRDFRGLRQQSGDSWSPALHAEFKRARLQREVFLELLDLSPQSLGLATGELPLATGLSPESVGQILRSELGMDDLPVSTWGKPSDLLNSIIDGTERLGILVIQTARVSPAEMQGFSISERPYPLIALNGKDSPRRKLFTLLHELGHVVLNVSGMCDPAESWNRPDVGDTTEMFCNETAAAILMPKDHLLRDPLVTERAVNHLWTLSELRVLSQRFGASSEAVLLRLVRLRAAQWQNYSLRKPEFDEEYERYRMRDEEHKRKSKGGPNYYTLKVRDLGRGYVSYVLDAFSNDAISSRAVATYLDVRFDQLDKLERRVS